MKNRLEFCATSKDKRLDKSISNHFYDISRSRAKNLIEEKMVKVNHDFKKPKYDLKQGDNVVINIPEPKTLDLEPENIPLDIVYEDNDVLVVNKPQGMVVHPSPGHPNHTLVNALLFHTPLSNINGTFRPGIVHRIDKDTSGLLMIAKNNDAHKSLSKQLKDKSNVREYIALVHGNIKEDKGKIDAPIGRSKKDRKKQAIIDDGKNAVTHFKVLERLGEYTLVSCVLETGRTHQIRVHMKYIGHPLVGDPLYGPRKTIKGNGQFLHAAKLGFNHPKTGKLMIFDAPLPEIFKETIHNLRNN
ncbi:RluA family pseudouridine synthase [Apilactobacillus quenuiae]|uniref:RluA family pseudouridine synthase n=1 Tax=Apilactobacillus quenuiae TaxID=2008377 RepID=UPI000D016EDF|nr:RluA family pseudouridine synthase [Apilactobacillus quenuiae]